MKHDHKHKDKHLLKENEVENDQQKRNREEIKQDDGRGDEKTEVKNAQASGIGALGRSEENQIERSGNDISEEDDAVY